jgi:hypothetical protein
MNLTHLLHSSPSEHAPQRDVRHGRLLILTRPRLDVS